MGIIAQQNIKVNNKQKARSQLTDFGQYLYLIT